jgi:hypothetical protein
MKVGRRLGVQCEESEAMAKDVEGEEWGGGGGRTRARRCSNTLISNKIVLLHEKLEIHL